MTPGFCHCKGVTPEQRSLWGPSQDHKTAYSVSSFMSVVRDLILQADDDLRYPTSGELRTSDAEPAASSRLVL